MTNTKYRLNTIIVALSSIFMMGNVYAANNCDKVNFQNIVQTINGKTCSSIQPVPICIGLCIPSTTTTAIVEFHCMDNTIPPELIDPEQKTVDKRLTISYPTSCKSPISFG